MFIMILMIVSGASLLMAGVVAGGQCRDAGRSVAEHDLLRINTLTHLNISRKHDNVGRAELLQGGAC